MGAGVTGASDSGSWNGERTMTHRVSKVTRSSCCGGETFRRGEAGYGSDDEESAARG